MKRQFRAILHALLAAVFYAVNAPFSKLLLARVDSTMMAAMLYLGAGLGIGALSLLTHRPRGERLSGADLPYTVGMVALDIAAPILLMLGLREGSSANASLLGNFEIVATTVIALVLFREAVTPRLWVAIGLITLSSMLLSFEGADSLSLSRGSLFVLLATVCWGFENNCTRNLASKDTYEIVFIKGLFSGLGALAIALVRGEALPRWQDAALAMLLGFVAYGLSIFMYVRAQDSLGAAKTSAYYAVAPFIGALLSFLLLKEALTRHYLVALAVMLAGTALVVADTLAHSHSHLHSHTFTHTHDGTTHTHTIAHAHSHSHYASEARHGHHHTVAQLEEGLRQHT